MPFRKNGAPIGRRSRPETPFLKWKTHEKGKNDDLLEDDENKSSAGFGGGRAKGNKKQKEPVVSVRKLAVGLWRLQLPETTAVARLGVQISCPANDKLLYILALLKLELVQKKVLIFTNYIDMSFRLKLFLEKFGIKTAVLNAEFPHNSRLHIFEEFNAGLFDYLIATDDSQTKEKDEAIKESNGESRKSKKRVKQKLDSEFGVVRVIDFKNVYTVINFEMSQSVAGYVHRIGRTGRAYSSGSSISLVSSDEMESLDEIRSFLGDDEDNGSKSIAEFPLLTKNAVESLRYRAEDVAKSVTKIAVRESRARDLRNEILNSEKLKAHFESNPRDLDLLKHDKVLSKNAPPHLRDVPDYLVDKTTKEARDIVKLASDAIGKKNRSRGSKRKFRKGGDPLKAISAKVSKRSRKDGHKRKSKKEV